MACIRTAAIVVDEKMPITYCRLFIIHAGWGPAGAAAALTLASVITILASASYVISSGLQDRVWGTPNKTALRVCTNLYLELHMQTIWTRLTALACHMK